MSQTMIAEHLIKNNSYFKWSVQRLSEKFNCSEKQINDIVIFLDPIKQQYLQNLKK